MSTLETTTDVLILGAGPVGLTLANELQKRGVGVRVADKAPGIREISKALIWHVRTQEALDKVGIMERGLTEAQPLKEVVVNAYGKIIGSWHLQGDDSPHPFPVIIGQHRTQHLLEDLLNSRGLSVEWNAEATAMQMDDDGVSVTLHHGETEADETVRCAYVVGCEGSNSLVRKTLGLTFEGERYSGEQFIQADCKLRWTLPSGRSYLFLTDDGYMMVIEMPAGLVRIFISIPDAPSAQPNAGQQEAAKSLGAAEDVSDEPTLGEIHDNFLRLTGIDVELSDAVWLARYRTSHRYANTFRQGRAFVAGDAGHVHVPIGGQGMNTGIQDAYNLGWKLAGVVKGDYVPSLLDTYDAERHPVAEALIRGTDRAYKGILHPAELQQRAARMFGPYVVRAQPVQNMVRNILEELTIAYPDGPLSRDCGGAKGPNPGERILDAPVVRAADRQTVTLNELVRPAEWTLLLFGGLPPALEMAWMDALINQLPTTTVTNVQTYRVLAATVPPTDSDLPVLLDGALYLHHAYGVTRPALYLIRPDSVVGFRGAAGDAPALLNYLTGIFRA